MERTARSLILALIVFSLVITPFAFAQQPANPVAKESGNTPNSLFGFSGSKTYPEPKSDGLLPNSLGIFVDVLGGRGLGELYNNYALFWDSVLALILFIGASMSAFKGKFNNSKAVPVVFGLILAISFSVFEGATGWRLAMLAPVAILVILFLLAYFVYTLIHGFSKNVVFSAAFAWLLVFAALMPPEVKNWLAYKVPEGWELITLISAFALIMVIVAIFRMFGRLFGGGSGTGSGSGFGGGGSGGGGNGAGSALGNLAHGGKSALDNAAKNEQKRQELGNRAKEAAQQLGTSLDNSLKKYATDATNKAEAADLLGKYLNQVQQFVEGIHNDIEPNVGKETFGIYQKELPNYAQRLREYFAAINEVHTKLAGLFDPEDIKAMNAQSVSDRQALRPQDSVGGLATEFASVDGWMKRKANMGYYWYTQRASSKKISEWIRALKDKADLEVDSGLMDLTSLEMLYKVGPIATSVAREAENASTSKASNLFGRNFGQELMMAAAAARKVSADIDNQAMLLRTTRNTLIPVRKVYEDLVSALDRREKIIDNWNRLIDEIGQYLDASESAVMKYIAQPTGTNYREARAPLRKAIENVQAIKEHIPEQGQLDKEITEGLAKIKNFENDPTIKGESESHFQRITTLLVETASAIDKAALLKFEVDAYGEVWAVHKDNDGSANGVNVTIFEQPKTIWDGAQTVIASNTKGAVARDYYERVVKLLGKIENVIAKQGRDFSTYKETAKTVDSLMVAAATLGVDPRAYTSDRNSILENVRRSVEDAKKDWEAVLAKLAGLARTS